MRIRIRPVLIGLLLFAGVRFLPTGLSGLKEVIASLKRETPVSENLRRKPSFKVVADRWTEFELPRNVRRLRLTTHACVSRDLALQMLAAQQNASMPSDELGWNYSLEFQLLDADGKLLEEGTHNFRSRVRFFRVFRDDESDAQQAGSEDAEVSSPVPGSYFADAGLLPTASRRMIVEANPNQSMRRVRVRLKNSETDIQELVLRVETRLNRTADECERILNRMREEDRAKLSRGLVHPHALLTDQEKFDLLANTWQSVAPAGIEGRDFLRRDVLFPRENSGEEVLPEKSQPVAIPRESVTVHVPEMSGILRTRLTFRPDVEFPARLTLHWFGRDGQRTNAEFLIEEEELSNSVLEFGRGVENGSLQIETPTGVRIQTWWRPVMGTANEEIELLAAGNWVSHYWLKPGGPAAIFDVAHIDGLATPLRLSIRRPAGDRSQVGRIAWTAWAGGERVESGEISVENKEQNGDYTSDEDPQLVTTASEHFLLLRSGIDRVEFYSSDDSVWLTAATRPPDRIPVTRVPEDFSTFSRLQSGQRQWFRLRAANHFVLHDEGAVSLVKTHWEPPAEGPDVLAGPHYSVEYRPGPNWLGREILSPRHPGAAFQQRSAAVVYAQIRANKNERVRFLSETGQMLTAPSLLLLRQRDDVALVNVIVDEQLVASEMVLGEQAMISLPPLDISRMPVQKIRVETADDSVQIFMNRIDPENRPSYLRRVANRFRPLADGAALSFEFEKQTDADELLTLRLYRERSNRQRTFVRAYIDGGTQPTTRSAWTNRAREFDLAPADEPPHVVLNTQERIDGGQVFFLKAGADLPPGRYSIHILCADHSPRYLTMTQLIAGARQEGKTWFESVEPVDSEFQSVR